MSLMKSCIIPIYNQSILYARPLEPWSLNYSTCYGIPLNTSTDASKALITAAEWYESHIEPVWRIWAPGGGSYANEGNVLSSTWKEGFYGENYDRLLDTKQKYDPNMTLFVWGGVGSDEWEYDLHSG